MHILGIDHKTILEDYLLTNEYLEKHGLKSLRKAAKKFSFDVDKAMPILIAHEDYIQGAFDAIEEDYVTIDDFIAQALGIGEPEIQQLQNFLLEK